MKLFGRCVDAKTCDQPPSGGCVLKLPSYICALRNPTPAAFRRLCVETLIHGVERRTLCSQPPSGGCVLKLCVMPTLPIAVRPAAFRRLCVETQAKTMPPLRKTQPPSGGCVLKRYNRVFLYLRQNQPPSGGCVLKLLIKFLKPSSTFQPPSGGCVLKQTVGRAPELFLNPSRLQAAVC